MSYHKLVDRGQCCCRWKYFTTHLVILNTILHYFENVPHTPVIHLNVTLSLTSINCRSFVFSVLAFLKKKFFLTSPPPAPPMTVSHTAAALKSQPEVNFMRRRWDIKNYVWRKKRTNEKNNRFLRVQKQVISVVHAVDLLSQWREWVRTTFWRWTRFQRPMRGRRLRWTW